MKFFVAFALAVAYVNAAAVDVRSADADAQITSYENEINPDGSFRYGFGSSNGIEVSANGQVTNSGTEQEALVIQGGVKYVAPDGTPIDTTYIAGPGGYQASGNAIPTPHPIPEYILRALAYIESHPPPALDTNKITVLVKNKA